ncbi:hypothetical protein EYF80_016175 [Liparis tanakae]|uniref:Uncharacterized protein n=1 Tax=Liparis tanakae TaxID=230148 RepID=A0A4Z2I6X6_9TELE|nr:hypothetical protein EYF80_016175 [Liparis tanakae]
MEVKLVHTSVQMFTPEEIYMEAAAFTPKGNVLNARPTAAYLLNAERKVFGATSISLLPQGIMGKLFTSAYDLPTSRPLFPSPLAELMNR